MGGFQTSEGGLLANDNHRSVRPGSACARPSPAASGPGQAALAGAGPDLYGPERSRAVPANPIDSAARSLLLAFSRATPRGQAEPGPDHRP